MSFKLFRPLQPAAKAHLFYMKLRHSIVTRFALFFTGLIIFAVLLSGYLVFKNASGVIVDYSKERLLHTSELAEQSFYALLQEVSNDIAVIEESPTLINFIDNPTENSISDIKEFFRAFLQNKTSYFQIRYIGVENNGQEIIRLDKVDGLVVESEELQEKGDKEYFKEAVKMEQGTFYFSQINLNEEYGVVSKPIIPTLRAASPIFDKKNNVLGIVIINVDLNTFFEGLSKIAGADMQLYMIDSDGQYLFANDQKLVFGVQLKTHYNFYNNFQLDKSAISNENFKQLSSASKDDLLSYFKQLPYFDGKRQLFLVCTIERSILMQSALLVRKGSLTTILLVCLISLIVSWFFVTYFSKRINQITMAMSNYDERSNVGVDLPVNRRDEIGTLAATFSRMRAKIDQQVEELSMSLEQEKQAKKQRDEFLQNMSHEMRTPLNAILGLTKLLAKNKPAPVQIPIINSLERSANSLAGLVYDVLDHRKIVEGELHIEMESVNIAELLKDIHATYQYDAIQKGLMFNLKIDDKIELQNFKTDALRLSQIIINLVMNAIKYTKTGTIDLEAKLLTTTNKSLVEIKVRDTGIGIYPENLTKINDRYFREQEDLSGRYGSYGLGLSIVKQLTALFGGVFEAVSEKGKGSEFTVQIQIVPIEKRQGKGIEQMVIMPRLQKHYTILHLEDDGPTQELMRYVLNDPQIDLIQIGQSDKLSHVLASSKVDLIISDLMLHGENMQLFLMDFLKQMKIQVPLIVTSALEPEIMSTISPLFFQKPFRSEQVRDMVICLLAQSEFKKPDFSALYSNYDYDVPKVNKVLDLLEIEFRAYLERIDSAVKLQNQTDWQALLHKLIVHIKHLKLEDLNKLPDHIEKLDHVQLTHLKNAFAFYLCCFRVEMRTNLKG